MLADHYPIRKDWEKVALAAPANQLQALWTIAFKQSPNHIRGTTTTFDDASMRRTVAVCLLFSHLHLFSVSLQMLYCENMLQR
jgi:hypothetical protein